MTDYTGEFLKYLFYLLMLKKDIRKVLTKSDESSKSVLLNYLMLVANECVQIVKTFDEIVTNVIFILVLAQACKQ